jgi:hypothetical protein
MIRKYFDKDMEISSNIAKKIIEIGIPENLGIVTYDINKLLTYEKGNLNSYTLLVGLANALTNLDKKSLLLINNTNSDNYRDIINFLSIIKKKLNKNNKDCSIFTFGIIDSNENINSDPSSIKIDQVWLTENPKPLNDLLSELSIRKVDLDLKKIKSQKILINQDELSSILIKYLGPPSFRESLTLKIDEEAIEKKGSEAASIAAGVGSFVVASSPTLLLLKGLKYISGIYNIFKKRKDNETKEFLEKWKNEVINGYSKNNLDKLVESNGLKNFEKELNKVDLVIIVNFTSNTIYDLFYPILIENILEDINKKQISLDYLIFDNLSYFSKFEYFMKIFYSKFAIPNKHFNLISTISTKNLVNTENTGKLIEEFMKYNNVFFDAASNFLSIIMGNQPLSEAAYIMNIFSEIKTLKDEDLLPFIYFDISKKPNWQIIKVPIKLSQKLKFLWKK